MNETLKSRLHLLYNGERARESVTVADETGLLRRLHEEPGTSLEALATSFGFVPDRLFKLLDVLETLGLVERTPRYAEGMTARYTLVPGAFDAVQAVFGAASQERDRETYPWRRLHGRLGEVLAGAPGFTAAEFSWPPASGEQTERFEASMVAGLTPICDAFLQHAGTLFPQGRPLRLLDVGGGDGTLAAQLVARVPNLHVDVLNLEAVRPLFARVRGASAAPDRLRFVAADFLAEELPTGYDYVTFVRVLHDWRIDAATELLDKGLRALEPRGKLVICEEFRTQDRLAAQLFWTYFLIGVDTCWSRLREAGAYVQLLEERGYAAEVLQGTLDLVVGRNRTHGE